MQRHEMEAQIAVILVSLPLPPMPIQVCRGEDAADGVCSSHDLHACMIATDMQRAAQGAFTQNEQEARMLRKACMLNKMQAEMQTTLSDPSLVQDDLTVQKCYGILGHTLRQYFSVYVHNCLDVRICPLDSVVASDTVHAHMLAYVKANLSLEIDPDQKISYVDLLKVWLKESFIEEPNTEAT